MKKKILHFQFESLNKVGGAETLSKILKYIKDSVGDWYVVIASPMTPSSFDVNKDEFVNFNITNTSIDELKNIIGK